MDPIVTTTTTEALNIESKIQCQPDRDYFPMYQLKQQQSSSSSLASLPNTEQHYHHHLQQQQHQTNHYGQQKQHYPNNLYPYNHFNHYPQQQQPHLNYHQDNDDNITTLMNGVTLRTQKSNIQQLSAFHKTATSLPQVNTAATVTSASTTATTIPNENNPIAMGVSPPKSRYLPSFHSIFYHNNIGKHWQTASSIGPSETGASGAIFNYPMTNCNEQENGGDEHFTNSPSTLIVDQVNDNKMTNVNGHNKMDNIVKVKDLNETNVTGQLLQDIDVDNDEDNEGYLTEKERLTLAYYRNEYETGSINIDTFLQAIIDNVDINVDNNNPQHPHQHQHHQQQQLHHYHYQRQQKAVNFD